MKKGKILSAFTSLAIAGTMLASALPFTASAATTVQTDLQLSMTSDKTSYTLDEIKAGATARVYVKADGEFQTANITSFGAKFKSSDWRVRAKNVEISYRNQFANNNGDRFSSFYSIATFGEWTKDFPVDQDMYEEYEGEIEDPISYAVKARTAITDTNMPAIQIISNKNIGYFKKGTGSSIAEFDVEFPTDLEAGTYSINFADVQLPVGIDDYGHLGDGKEKSATGITFTIGDGQSTTTTTTKATTATTKATTATTKATAATTKATAASSGTGIVLDRDYTGTIKLSAEKVSAKAGDSKVAVNIYADTNGFTIENLTFKLEYDSSKLTLNKEESFKKGLGLRPGTTTFEASTNVYLFLISGDTPAVNYKDKPIGTVYFDVASDATGELPVKIVPGQGLAKIECLQYSESKNGLKKFYLDPEVTDGAIVLDNASTTKLTSNTKPTIAKTTVKSTSASSGTGIVLDRDYTGTIKLSAEKVSAKAGDSKVAVNIYADTNGFTIENLTFKLEYDSSKLTLNKEESFKKGLGLRPGTTTFEASTNVYLFLISGDTPAVNYKDKPIGTVYFDVASDATGELPVKIVPGQGLAKIECLQYSESKNGLKKFYLDPDVTDGAIVLDNAASSVTTKATAATTTTKSNTTTAKPTIITTTSTTKLTSNTKPTTAKTTVKSTSSTSGTGIVLDRDYTGTIKLSAEKVSAKAGDSKVAVNIYADTNGFTIENLTFKLEYDSSKLTLNKEESFKKGLGLRPGTTTFEASTNVYLFLISGDTPAVNYKDKPIGTVYFDVASDATGELPVKIVPGQGLAKIECLQYSESKNGLKKFYLDPEVTDGAVVIGSSSSDDLTVEVDDSALDTKGDNINWYFADEAEFDKSNITVMSGDKDVTADADIKFDSTPGKTYNGKTFDYTVSYTATYGGKTANGTVDVKIGLRGDANCNHKVDARDAAAIAKDLAQLYGSKKTTLTKKNGEFALFLANVDESVAKKETAWYGKRELNARDAATIAKYLSMKFANPNLRLVDIINK